MSANSSQRAALSGFVSSVVFSRGRQPCDLRVGLFVFPEAPLLPQPTEPRYCRLFDDSLVVFHCATGICARNLCIARVGTPRAGSPPRAGAPPCWSGSPALPAPRWAAHCPRWVPDGGLTPRGVVGRRICTGRAGCEQLFARSSRIVASRRSQVCLSFTRRPAVRRRSGPPDISLPDGLAPGGQITGRPVAAPALTHSPPVFPVPIASALFGYLSYSVLLQALSRISLPTFAACRQRREQYVGRGVLVIPSCAGRPELQSPLLAIVAAPPGRCCPVPPSPVCRSVSVGRAASRASFVALCPCESAALVARSLSRLRRN